jgi:hypothetical protein
MVTQPETLYPLHTPLPNEDHRGNVPRGHEEVPQDAPRERQAQCRPGLKEAGITKHWQFNDDVSQTEDRFYQKLTFEGHKALKLLARRPAGKLAVEHTLNLMWPSGDLIVWIRREEGFT